MLVVGGVGYGILGDIAIGIVGAFLGSWIFSALHVQVPFGGIGGTIFVAFIGAVVLLLVLGGASSRAADRVTEIGRAHV